MDPRVTKMDGIKEAIASERFHTAFGTVLSVRRDAICFTLPAARVGSLCSVKTQKGSVPVEVVSLDRAGQTAMPLDDLSSVGLGDVAVLQQDDSSIGVGDGLLGKVIDSLGRCYETNNWLPFKTRLPIYGISSNPMERVPIREAMDLGVRSINACLTCGRGQRQGIFAGSGVGKSVLLGMMARYTSADVVVIALVGERGREVREFIENELGPEGRKKSVVVVETAEKSAVRRVRGAYAATTIAEYFRSQGKHVLLMMDSLTRFAMAQREIGMAAGEPPTTKGYTPSVFTSLSRLIERAGNFGEAGSITGLYTVLVEGDDLEDPVADAARAILDGHIILSRRLANRGHFPAVDVLGSVSRVMDQVTQKTQRVWSNKLKEVLARYRENEDAILYGQYLKGTDGRVDECIELEPRITGFLRQDRSEQCPFTESGKQLQTVFGN